MTALLVVLMFVALVLVDLAVRAASSRMREARTKREREAVLQSSVRIDFTHEARSLKRVQVTGPKARILAVDDEPVVLDSLRKILVLDGYDVDTVESGPEALGLVQRHDYDFVFTDLKMPGMDGVEVVKAVKHLRPDVDVAVITGYATIETAVETMAHGACDYVQKPFTPDELKAFAGRLRIKREARLDAMRRPTVRVVAPEVADAASSHEYCVPGGSFIGPGHTWARIEPNGQVRIGLDDFARKALGAIDGVQLPVRGGSVQRGDILFSVKNGDRTARLTAPLGGRIVQVNEFLQDAPGLLGSSPYDSGWVCRLQPSDLAAELSALRIGRSAIDWYQQEIARMLEVKKAPEASGAIDWQTLEDEFLLAAKGAAVS